MILDRSKRALSAIQDASAEEEAILLLRLHGYRIHQQKGYYTVVYESEAPDYVLLLSTTIAKYADRIDASSIRWTSVRYHQIKGVL